MVAASGEGNVDASDVFVETQSDLSEGELREFLGQRISRIKIPKTFEFISERLRDDAGKVRRATLAERVSTSG